MPCLLGCFALVFPRVALLLVWLVDRPFIDNAFVTWIWPVLGFVFMPLTTLAYALAMNRNGGSVNGGYLFLVIVAALFDLGFLGGGEASRRRWRRRNY